MAESFTVQAILTVKDNMSAAFRNAAGASGSLGGKMKGLIGTGAALQVGMSAVSKGFQTISSHVGDAVKRYDQLNNFPRVMNNLGISSKDANAALKQLDKGITGLPTTLDSATQGVTRFVSKNGDIKKSTDYFLAMNNAVLAGGASAESQGYAIEQLSQAYSKGKMDMEEWRSIQTAMPAQLNQVAKAMGMTSDELGEGLRNGTISMDEFMDTMVKLNEEGVDGLASFEEQALTATGGIGTAFTNMGTAITRGITTCIGAIDEMLADNELPTIAEIINKVGKSIGKAFDKAASVIKKVNLKGIIAGLTPAFETLKMVASGAGKVIGKVAGFLNRNAEAVSSFIPVILLSVAAFKGYKKVSGFLKPVTESTEKFIKVQDLAAKGAYKLKSGLGALAKMAGIALIVTSLALLAKAMGDIGKLGPSAIAPMVTFGVVVGGLAAVFSAFGTKLQASMKGIAVFSAAVSLLAFTMAPIAQTGLEGAAAMGAFGIVVAGLVVIFSMFGTALNVAIPGMLAFGAAILLVGTGMRLATPFVQALTEMIRQLGNTISQVAGAISSSVSTILGAFGNLVSTIAGAVSQVASVIGGTLCSVMVTAGNVVSQVVDSICGGFDTICDGVSKVIDAISGGLATVLDSIAGIIESVGTSARNAGEGFKSVAEGIGMIAELSIGEIAKSLGAVAIGIGTISAKGENLPQVAGGMQMLMSAIMIGVTSITAFNAALVTMSGMVTGVVSNVTKLKAAFSNFVITPPNIGPFIAAFNQITVVARMLIPSLTSAGRAAGAGLASGLSSGARQAQGVIRSVSASIVATVRSMQAQLIAAALAAGVGFSSALKSGLTKAVSIAKQAALQINMALKSAQRGSFSAGRNIGAGLALGMRSQLGAVRAAAAQLAAAAEAAIRAKAKIHSPSRVSGKLGAYFGIGWINNIKSKISEARKWAERLVYIPNIKQPDFAVGYGGYTGGLNDNYSYGGGYYVIEVPVELDGKEVARIIAPYEQEELNRRERRESRKKGRR